MFKDAEENKWSGWGTQSPAIALVSVSYNHAQVENVRNFKSNEKKNPHPSQINIIIQYKANSKNYNNNKWLYQGQAL